MNRALKLTVSVAGVLLTVVLAVGCGNTAKVDSGNTTQVVQGNGGEGRGMFGQRSAEETKALLEPLVEDKTITQQQADSVALFFEKQAEERRNSMREGQPPEDGSKSPGTQAPRNQVPRNQGQRPNPLKELVDNKTITQEQADKISEVLFQRRGQGPPTE